MSLVVFEVLTLFLSFPVMFLKFETWNLLPECLNVCKMTVRFRVNMLFPQGLSKGFDAMMRHHIAFCTMTLLQYFVFLGRGWTTLRHTAQHTHTHTHTTYALAEFTQVSTGLFLSFPTYRTYILQTSAPQQNLRWKDISWGGSSHREGVGEMLVNCVTAATRSETSCLCFWFSVTSMLSTLPFFINSVARSTTAALPPLQTPTEKNLQKYASKSRLNNHR